MKFQICLSPRLKLICVADGSIKSNWDVCKFIEPPALAVEVCHSVQSRIDFS